MNPVNIHISDIRNFRACRRKWDWSSGLRQNLEPSIPYPPFFVGRAIHYCLENYYGAGVDIWDSLEKYIANETKIAGHMWKQELDKWDESLTLISELLQHYMLWAQVDTSAYRDDTLEFLDLEIPFNVPMFNPETGIEDERIRLEGRFDGIVLHKPTGKYWIWETKTARSIGELTKSLENDEQAGAYIYAAQQLKDIQVEGVLYNILRKKAPTHPKVLITGMLSKSKSADMTAFSYVSDVKKHHGDVEWSFIEQHYGDIIYSMSIGNNGFFSRLPIHRSQYEIGQLVNNLYWTAVEMIDPNTKIYPAPAFIQCNFCPFRAPCLTKNRGGNYEQLIEAEYQLRTKAESLREVEL